LRGVRQTQLGGVPMLALDMDHTDDQYSGALHWDEPPSLRRVSEILHAHVGEPVRAVGDLLISGFYGAELRPHIREMLRDGRFPRALPPAIQRAEAGRVTPTSIVIGTAPEETCDLCGDYGPHMSYPRAADRGLRMHARVRSRVERRAAAAIDDRRTQESGGLRHIPGCGTPSRRHLKRLHFDRGPWSR